MARTCKTWSEIKKSRSSSTAAMTTTDDISSTTDGSAAAAAAIAAAAAPPSTKQPKTVLDKIVYAIRQQPPSSKGVSRLAITKYLKAELDYDNPNATKTALKKGVDKGVLEQTGQSFRVKGDPMAQEEVPKLVIEDIAVGGGGEEGGEDEMVAQDGDSVTVKYVGKLDDGHQFDKAPNFTFTLGAGDVIKGWDQGVKGMKVGGKRKLIVPSKLGYGKRGSAPDIPPDAVLHFQVTLKNISRP